jgi:hypothetical protein
MDPKPTHTFYGDEHWMGCVVTEEEPHRGDGPDGWVLELEYGDLDSPVCGCHHPTVEAICVCPPGHESPHVACALDLRELLKVRVVRLQRKRNP